MMKKNIYNFMFFFFVVLLFLQIIKKKNLQEIENRQTGFSLACLSNCAFLLVSFREPSQFEWDSSFFFYGLIKI